MSSQLRIKDSSPENTWSKRPQSHDARFPQTKTQRTFERFASPPQSAVLGGQQVIVREVPFPFDIAKIPFNPPKPQMVPGSPMMASPTQRVGTTMASSFGDSPQQVIRRRLSHWFTQYNTRPDIQVKNKFIPQWQSAGGSGSVRAVRESPATVSMLNEYQIISPDTDLSTLVDAQVCFLQRSPQKAFIESIVSQPGAVFTDTIFTPDWPSLYGEYPWDEQWSRINWVRMTTNPSAVIFAAAIEPTDIIQGKLGDCYYLAALAALAERPQRIRDVFLTTTISPSKIFSCKIMYKGKWKEIYLDDFVPCDGWQSAFSQSVNNQMWVELLEKAWAKLYSSYKRIDAGIPEEALHDLTGAHIQTYRLQSTQADYEKVWQYLLQAERKGYAMVGSTLSGSDKNIPTSGVVLGHAYTIYGAYEIQYKGQTLRLVLCRNPWGQVESNLAWNDRDPRWNEVPLQERQRIGFNPTLRDGIFFVDYSDFCRNFRMITSAEVDDRASYVFLTQSARDDRKKYFRVQIFREGDYSFQVNQIPDRRYPEGYIQYYEYVPITMNIGKVVSPDRLEYFEGSQSSYRTLFKKHHLQPGIYLVFTEIQFDPRWQTDYQVTLGIYGTSVCQISVPNQQQTAGFHNRLFLDRAYKTRRTATDGIFYNQEILPQGFIYAACFNYSSAPVTLRIQLQTNQNPKVYMMDQGIQPIFEKLLRTNDYFIIVARVLDFQTTTSRLCNMSLSR